MGTFIDGVELLEISGPLLPSPSGANLGSAANPWGDLYFGGNIYPQSSPVVIFSPPAGTSASIELQTLAGFKRLDISIDDSGPLTIVETHGHMSIQTKRVDAANAIGLIVTNSPAFTASGTRIISFQASAVEKAAIDKDGILVSPGAKPTESFTLTIPDRGGAATWTALIESDQTDIAAAKVLKIHKKNATAGDVNNNWLEVYDGTRLLIGAGSANIAPGINFDSVDLCGFTFFRPRAGGAGNLFAPTGTMFIKDIITGSVGLAPDISGAAPAAANLPSMWMSSSAANGATAQGFYFNQFYSFSTTGAKHSTWANNLGDIMALVKDASAWHLDLPVASSSYYVAGTKVVGPRETGWTAPTGTALKTGYATGTATLDQVAQTVKAVVDLLVAHGLAGA